MRADPRSAVARVSVRDKHGTGFAVARDLVVTCLHVVADRKKTPVVPDGAIEVRFPGHDGISAELVDFDVLADWALLRCVVPEGIDPLVLRPATPGGGLKRSWWTFGYPDLNKVDGSTVLGEVRNLAGTYNGVPAIELYSEELKATPVHGHSGSPCFEGDDQDADVRVIGVIRSAIVDDERCLGKVYAAGADAVLGSELLAAQRAAAEEDRPRDRGAVRGGATTIAEWEPREHETFIGRGDEVAALDAALAADGARVAVVAVQGMPGVGKTYLVEEWCARNRGRFGPLCRWVLDPPRPAVASSGLLELAAQAGIDCDRTPVEALPGLLADRRALIHIDNVDSDGAADVVVELLGRVPKVPAIVTGRLSTLGTAPNSGWRRVEVECLDVERSVELLRAELGPDAPDDASLRSLAVNVGGLPLALHLAVGYLRGGYTVDGFLRRLRSSGFSLEHVDRADPVWRERSRGIVSLSFQISRELFLETAGDERDAWAAALSAFGWAVASGVGRELGAAITALTADGFAELIRVASALSLVRRVSREERPDGAWSVHPLLAEYLRASVERSVVDERIGAWIAELGDRAEGNRAERWSLLTREGASVHAWLAVAKVEAVARVAPHCWAYATSHGPVAPWLDAVGPACEALSGNRRELAWAWAQLAWHVGDHGQVLCAAAHLVDGGNDWVVALGQGLRADVLAARGEPVEALRILREEVLPVFERVGNVRGRAAVLGKVADILVLRGELEEALRIRREDELAVYERMGEIRECAVTLGKIADVLVARGEPVEALRILIEEALPVFAQLGDIRARAVALGKVADILAARGELVEALRILREEALPVYERLGDVKERALTVGKVADILAARGEFVESLRIRREEELPVYEQLGAVRERAVALGKVADILAARGELEESLRILREEMLPVYDKLGDVRERALTLGKVADIHAARGETEEALRLLRVEVEPAFARLGAIRSRAVALGKVADILTARGDLEEALRIRREEELPVYERLGDIRERALTRGKVAFILAARGEVEEAVRIRREEELPVFERLGGRDLMVGLANLGILLLRRGTPADLVEARGLLVRSQSMAQAMGMPFPDRLAAWIANSEGSPEQ